MTTDTGNTMALVVLDLSSAFDIHGILLSCLEHCIGIRGTVLSYDLTCWIGYFLSDLVTTNPRQLTSFVMFLRAQFSVPLLFSIRLVRFQVNSNTVWQNANLELQGKAMQSFGMYYILFMVNRSCYHLAEGIGYHYYRLPVHKDVLNLICSINSCDITVVILHIYIYGSDSVVVRGKLLFIVGCFCNVL